jgi:hypothetical protein
MGKELTGMGKELEDSRMNMDGTEGKIGQYKLKRH